MSVHFSTHFMFSKSVCTLMQFIFAINVRNNYGLQFLHQIAYLSPDRYLNIVRCDAEISLTAVVVTCVLREACIR